MATLKYRDTNGNFIRIPSIQGPPGPKGDKGDKGATGPAGGILDVTESSTTGYISVKKADGTSKNVKVGVSGSFLPLSGGTITNGTITFENTTAAPTNGAILPMLRGRY